jgi:hypothetical protein
MRLHFDETMAGTVSTPDGRRRFAFTGRADAASPLAMVGWAPFRLEGTASLEGAVQDAPLLPGSLLEIGLPLHRHLRYQVHFRDGAGNLYRFFGQKTVYLRALPRTMTTLDGTLFRNGAELGPATLRFDLKELPKFLLSFSVQAT